MLQNKILILGMGNYLMGDEGVGVHAALRLQTGNLSSDIDIADGGAGGFRLLEYFEKYKTIILIDAAPDNKPAGTITLIKPGFAQDFPLTMSNNIELKDKLNALQVRGKMPEIHFLVVSIESLQQQSTELTAAVKNVLPQLIDKVKHLVNELRDVKFEQDVFAWAV